MLGVKYRCEFFSEIMVLKCLCSQIVLLGMIVGLSFQLLSQYQYHILQSKVYFWIYMIQQDFLSQTFNFLFFIYSIFFFFTFCPFLFSQGIQSSNNASSHHPNLHDPQVLLAIRNFSYTVRLHSPSVILQNSRPCYFMFVLHQCMSNPLPRSFLKITDSISLFVRSLPQLPATYCCCVPLYLEYFLDQTPYETNMNLGNNGH